MRFRLIVLCASLCACSDAPPAAGPPQIAELAGRVAGPPEQCVTFRPNETLQTTEADRHVLLYRNGNRLWVNHLGSCSFGRNDVLVVERTGSDLCRGEIIRSFDAISKIPGPACVLGDFIPYSR